jgi:hypothetical protein
MVNRAPAHTQQVSDLRDGPPVINFEQGEGAPIQIRIWRDPELVRQALALTRGKS